VVLSYNSPNSKATYSNAETLIDLHGNSAVAVARVSLLYFYDEVDHFLSWCFSTWLFVTVAGIQEIVFLFH